MIPQGGKRIDLIMMYAIIAAGEGSRLLQEGFKGLKPMVRVNGEMLIDRLIRIFLANRASSIILLINEQSQELDEHLKRLDLPVPLRVFVRSTPSSFHSFYELLKQDGSSPEEICLTTTDSVFDEKEFHAYINDFSNNRNNDGLLAVTSFVDDESPLYINADLNHVVTEITDVSNAAHPSISGGIYCLRKKALALVPAAMEKGIARMRNFQKLMIAEGLKLEAFPFGKIIDIDHVTDIAKAETFLKEAGLTNNTYSING
jgi:NDP-sugar pyrophosphorylase family protein